jgi:hypothetical protein
LRAIVALGPHLDDPRPFNWLDVPLVDLEDLQEIAGVEIVCLPLAPHDHDTHDRLARCPCPIRHLAWSDG